MDGGAPGQQLSPTEEQEKWLHEAFKAVKQHAFYMKRALVRAFAASGARARQSHSTACIARGRRRHTARLRRLTCGAWHPRPVSARGTSG
jgi:hypothetical protein